MTISPSALADYAQLRNQMASLQRQIKAKEEEAISEALTLISANQTVNGQCIVFSDRTLEIILQMRTTKPKASEHQDLETLAELIAVEQEKAEFENKDAISLITEQISALETQLTQLQMTEEGLKYQKEYQDIEKQMTTKKPILKVKFS